MKINVVLCYPPYKQYEGFGQEKRWLPLGIASIGAYLRRTYTYDETEIVLLDLFNESLSFKKSVFSSFTGSHVIISVLDPAESTNL
jgi:hypothetical protein